MKIDVNWQNAAHTIVRWTFHANWTIEDLHAAFDASSHLMCEQAHPVAMILDAQIAGGVKGNVLGAVRARYRDLPDHYAGCVFVGGSPFGKLLAQILADLPWTAGKFVFAETISDAEARCEDLRTQAATVREGVQ